SRVAFSGPNHTFTPYRWARQRTGPSSGGASPRSTSPTSSNSSRSMAVTPEYIACGFRRLCTRDWSGGAGEVPELGVAAGGGEQLALAGGQRPAPFGNDMEVPAGQASHEVVGAHGPGRLLHLRVRGRRAAVGDVVADGAGEQERLLGHVAQLLAVGGQVQLGYG